VDCSLSDIDLRVAEVDYADCGLATGKVFLRATGGAEPYTYSLNDNNQSSALFQELRSDFYTFHVTDRNGCVDSVQTFVGSNEGVTGIAAVTPSGCQGDVGIIEVTALNGNPPYRYQLGENTDYTDSPIFTELPAGTYSIWIADANDCSIGIYVDIPTGVSFNNTVRELIVANCATETCHGGAQSPELMSYDDISDESEEILSIIDSHAEGVLSEEEIRNVKCWIEDGAPNN